MNGISRSAGERASALVGIVLVSLIGIVLVSVSLLVGSSTRQSAGFEPTAVGPLETAKTGGIHGFDPVAGVVDRLGWLAGCWEGTLSSGAGYEEVWLAPRAGVLIGMARMTRDGGALSFEFMRILDDGGTRVYAAQPSGRPPTHFRATVITPDETIFENPDHDFPQRILHPSDAGGLHARIEGDLEGELRALDFPLRRIVCPGFAGGSSSTREGSAALGVFPSDGTVAPMTSSLITGLAPVQIAPIGSALSEGLQLIYASGGAEQAPWVYDSVRVVERDGFDRCLITKRRSLAARESCVRGDTLFERDGPDGRHRAVRPIGANMQLEIRSASGDLLQFETGEVQTHRIAEGLVFTYLPTTIVTRGPDGATIRRLRESYAPSLLTALWGVFEEPAEAGAWTATREFSLVGARRSPAAPSRPGETANPTSRIRDGWDALMLAKDPNAAPWASDGSDPMSPVPSGAFAFRYRRPERAFHRLRNAFGFEEAGAPPPGGPGSRELSGIGMRLILPPPSHGEGERSAPVATYG